MQNPNSHEINKLTKQLNRLRLQRQDFYLQVDAEEVRLLDRIRQANASSHSIVPSPRHSIVPSARHCESGRNIRPTRRDREETLSVQTPVDLPSLEQSEVPLRVSSAPTSQPAYSYRTVNASRELKIGDRVKITNKIRFVSGRPTDKDRLATVVRKTQFYIHLVTDSGYTTSRAAKNLLQILGEDEQSQSEAPSRPQARARNGLFLDF
jgi:hypothetical protein